MHDRANDRAIAAAPNYTGACIVMFGVNLAWVLLALLALAGLPAVLIAGLALHYAIKWLEWRRR